MSVGEGRHRFAALVVVALMLAVGEGMHATNYEWQEALMQGIACRLNSLHTACNRFQSHACQCQIQADYLPCLSLP